MLHYLWLVPLSVIIGLYGTLIGSGSGFALVPLLLFLYPNESPEVITSISLAVVFFNALSGTVAYGKMRWINYRAGIVLAAATIPGAILGALSSAYATRHFFEPLFGALLIAAALYLLLKHDPHQRETPGGSNRRAEATSEPNPGGLRHPFNWKVGVASSFAVGYASSLLGIGGGIIHVPIMVHLLHFPVKIATATSLFIIVIRSLAGAATHIPMGSFSGTLPRVMLLSLGVIIGAQLGARLSSRIHSGWIIRALVIALVFLAVRMLWGAL